MDGQMIERRSFLTGLIALVAAPAIVRAGSLMPVKQMIGVPEYEGPIFTPSLHVLYGDLKIGDWITFSGFSSVRDVREFVVTGITSSGHRLLRASDA